MKRKIKTMESRFLDSIAHQAGCKTTEEYLDFFFKMHLKDKIKIPSRL